MVLNITEVPQKIKSYRIIHSKENQHVRWHLHSYVHRSTRHNSQETETSSVSINRWTGKDNMVHINNMKFCHLQQYGWNLKSLYTVK
jgi:DUF4097 and DUF4098 domain-containing protein YvlB